MNSQIMSRFLVTKLLVVLAMLLSIVGGPAVASSGGCVGTVKVCAKKCCCGGMGCCAMKDKQPAEQKPAPVQQQVGQDLATAVTAAPFSLLFTFAPTEAKRVPRAFFAEGHAPGPLAVSCIRLI